MGCGCGKKNRSSSPAPVDADAPNPNREAEEAGTDDAWWQATPKLPPTAAVPMPH